ncbi:branched-chain amino acid ABC transporter permease [Desulfatitalea alkaliphila]|uniref:Branched-chain amino acid ABC transporter permease n=1 Tax=Desulfatitalea alkaliphila TaxID=2929485 RepID=A0AA41R4M7_9BACT|nr:branched-chain amino acid ABC transporter permease [Desulfatitalea alkaliphila]MCJ8499223.1 branched-chain amino acid ABC transporter permease [Desulfatitalea alkaliphila]
MELFLQQIFNGVMLGSTYALVALGLTLVFGILQVPNFAHGHMYMLGAYVCFFLMTVAGFAYWPALAAAALLLAVAGGLLELLVFRPLRNGPHLNAFIAALGALMILENVVTLLWGPRAYRIPNPYPGFLDVYGVMMTPQRLLVIAAAIVLIVLLQLFIKKTKWGGTIEAVAQNSEGARLVGINADRVATMTFAIATALAAVAACLVAPIFLIAPGMGTMVGMKAFVIVILGGLGSIPGAILGGYLLGLIEALGGGYLSAAYKDVYGFGALVLILAIKPTGLFGKEIQDR